MHISRNVLTYAQQPACQTECTEYKNVNKHTLMLPVEEKNHTRDSLMYKIWDFLDTDSATYYLQDAYYLVIVKVFIK